MNIEKEVSKYKAKKDRLLSNLLSRLYTFSSEKSIAVDNINETITDLNEKKEENIQEIQKEALVINDLEGK